MRKIAGYLSLWGALNTHVKVQEQSGFITAYSWPQHLKMSMPLDHAVSHTRPAPSAVGIDGLDTIALSTLTLNLPLNQ